MRLIICKGLQASGKTTYAKKLELKGWVRVEKDEIRKNSSLFKDGVYNHRRGDEKIVLKERDRLIRKALDEGKNVISSDTNLRSQHIATLTSIAREYDIKPEIKSFLDVPLAELIERDSKRENPVGEQVIRRTFHENFVKLPTFHQWQEGLPFVIWVDIDGTLTSPTSLKKRSPYDYTKVLGDDPNLLVTAIVDGLRVVGYTKIFIFSGREDSCRADTEAWLEKHDIEYDKLVMRKTGDTRNDSIIKEEMFREHIEGKYNCLGVIDDRVRVSKMARDVLGLNTLQAGDPYYEF